MKYVLVFFLMMRWMPVFAQAPSGVYINFSPGIWVPVGNLRKTFNNSAKLNLNFIAQGDKMKLQVVGEMVFNNGNQPFNYHGVDTSFVSSRKLTMGSVGLHVGRMKALSATSYLEKFGGIGYSSISMDVKKLKSECVDYQASGWHFGEDECEGDKKYDFQMVESFYLTAGVELQKVIFKDRVVGVQAAYRFTPYAWFGKVEKGFGASSLSANISFRF